MTKAIRFNIGTTEAGKPFTLPQEIINQSVAILAKRRVGKSYTADIVAEEFLAMPQQSVIVDPTGVHWGLRSSADGKKAGYPIVVVGGKHADIPLDESSGEMLARAIVEQKFSAIIDTSLLKKGQTLRFLDAYLGTLYHLNEDPLHLFLDEVDYYCPQKPMTPQAAITGSHVDDLVRRGGVKGIGVTLITQRSSVVNKDVLTQCEVLIALRLIHPLDIKPVMDWVGVHGDTDQAKLMVKSLPDLPVGTAWVWWPSEKIFNRIEIRKKTTFDSGRSPKPGDKVKTPKVLAQVDLELLGEKMKASIEAAKANDPKALQLRVSTLERENAQLQKAKTPAAAAPAMAPKDLQRRLDAAKAEGFQEGLAAAPPASEAVLVTLGGIFNRFKTSQDYGLKDAGEFIAQLRKEGKQVRRPTAAAAPAQMAPAMRPAAAPAAARRDPATNQGDTGDVAPRHQRFLDVLAMLKAYEITPVPRPMLASQIGVSHNTGSFKNDLSLMRTAGLIDYAKDGGVILTDAGSAAAKPPAAMSLEEYQGKFLDRCGPKKREILAKVIECHPQGIDRESLAAAVQVSHNTGSFKNYLSELRTMGAIDYRAGGGVIATPIIFPEGLH